MENLTCINPVLFGVGIIIFAVGLGLISLFIANRVQKRKSINKNK